MNKNISLSTEDKRILYEIVRKINEDPTGMRRYLCSTPLVRLPRNNYDGMLKNDFFWNHIYFESNKATEEKEKLYAFLNNNSGKNTMFIVGYEGCGKTTFINALLEYYETKQRYSKNKRIVFDCGRHGANAEDMPITRIFNQNLFKFIQDNEDILLHFIEFFRTNRVLINDLMNQDRMNSFYQKVVDFVKIGHKISDPGHFQDLKKYVLDNLNFKDVLYLITFFALSKDFTMPMRKENLNPIILFIDNLDYIENYSELRSFVKAIDDYTIEMSSDDFFRKLTLYKDSSIKTGFVDKIKVIIAMRETTKANLPVDHYSNAFNDIYEIKDITNLYDKDQIVKQRLFLIESLPNLAASKKNELTLIKNIIQDSVFRDTIVPLYNNDYRSTIDVLTEISTNSSNNLNEFIPLIRSKHTYVHYGARGIVLKYIFDILNNKKIGKESCFKKIGVLDLTNRRRNSVSVARMILSLLSNKTDTCCDNGHNGVSISYILDHFKGILPADEIKKSLWNMYDLKDSPKWSHLISFSQIVTKNKSSSVTTPLTDFADFDLLDFDRTLVHYSCAGQIYLERVSSHFEFFSTRCYPGNPKPALYCKENWSSKGKISEYMFLDIIKNIYEQVQKCCEALRKFNIKICSNRHNLDNPYESPDSTDYFESPFVALNKDKKSSYSFHQLHENRIINAHIGYIDRFRLYLLNDSNFPESKKVDVNKKLLDEIKNYIDLLDSILIDDHTRYKLMPYYNCMYKLAIENPEDFTISINVLEY